MLWQLEVKIPKNLSTTSIAVAGFAMVAYCNGHEHNSATLLTMQADETEQTICILILAPLRPYWNRTGLLISVSACVRRWHRRSTVNTAQI